MMGQAQNKTASMNPRGRTTAPEPPIWTLASILDSSLARHALNASTSNNPDRIAGVSPRKQATLRPLRSAKNKTPGFHPGAKFIFL
jgi:hypothetical protein